MPPRIEEGGPEASDFILFPAIRHASIPDFFVGGSYSCLFQTAFVACSGNLDITQKVVFHHHFEITSWFILTPFIFFFFFSVKARIWLKVEKLYMSHCFPRKFYFFGGRLQKKLFVLYKLHHCSYNFISPKIILLSILERRARDWVP